ncbi:MAG: outer membrane protein assembly factor BamA [Ignavibacteria bacterium]|jgi:outer membrane protein insertion porin family
MKYYRSGTACFYAIFILLITALYTTRAFAQGEEGPATYRVISITTEGNKFYDSKIIIANSGLKIGSEVTIPSSETTDAINRLWNLNLFSDIDIVVDKKIGNDAYFVIKVTELPKLDDIKFSGNDEFSEKDLRDKIPLSKGEVITPQTLKDIEYNIKKMYIDEGYPLSEVKVDDIVNSSNDAQVRVKINEGSKLSVKKILFEGNYHVPASALRGSMDATSELQWWKFWEKARFNKDDYDKDKHSIVDYYREQGYKDASIISDNFSYSHNKELMDIKIKVNEGKRYRINSIRFTGNKIYKDTLLLERLELKPGDIYNAKKFEQNLKGNENQTDIASLYLDNGYLGLQQEIEENVVDENKVDLTIHITENKQYRIGLISFTGNTKTQDKVIRRELYTLPGQYFNKADMFRSLRQLNSLNYFNPEKLNYDFVQRNDTTVDLVYSFDERSSDQLNASVGWSQTFGISGSVGVTFNNFDISDPFSGGAGQILSFQWDFGSSGTFRTFSLGFTEPWLYNTPTLVGVNLFDTYQNYTFAIRETGGTLNFGRRFKFPDDYFRGDWFIKFDRTDVIDGAGIYETGVRNQLSIGQTITRNSTDNPIFPTIGSKVALGVEIAGANLIGSINFQKYSFSAEAYNRLDNVGKLILYSNMLFQTISSLAKDGYIPPNEYLFMGGSGLAYNTVALRGYDDRTIGPLNSAGNSIGGRVLLKYGVELRYSLTQDPIPVYFSLFGEAGNVWPSFRTFNPLDIRRSVGFGIRLMLPAVGIIGFDLGYGFDRKIVDNQSPAWLFHFQFGKGF